MMRKLGVLLLTLTAVCMVAFSLVFFTNATTKENSAVEQPAELTTAAVNGGGWYKFDDGVTGPNRYWFFSIVVDDDYTAKTVSNNVSINTSNAELVIFQFGAAGGTGRYSNVDPKSYFSIWQNGNQIRNKVKFGDINYPWAYTATAEGEYRVCVNPYIWGIESGWQRESWWGDTYFTFNIDRTAPIITLNNVSNGGITNGSVSATFGTQSVKAGGLGKSFSADVLTAKYSVSTLGNGVPNTASTKLSNGASFATNGHYRLAITDSAGNQNDYTFTIDKTAPSNNFAYALNDNKAYTSEDINYKPTDNYLLDTSWVKFEDGPWVSSQAEADAAGYRVRYNGNEILVPKDDNNGNWYFKASDVAGNYSDEQCVVLNVLQTFGNQSIIAKSFKTNNWYNVVLPANIFGVAGKDIAGTYHAASYQTALAFATTKEWEYRVSAVSNGWMYVSAGNGNLAQLYTDKSELDSVVEKYAKSYVKERSIAKNGENNFANIINEDLYVDDTALTRQHLVTPNFLNQDLPVYLMRQTYKFVDPGFSYDTFVKIQMVANDYGLVERDEFQLSYDIAVANQIFMSGNNGQGYYLVTEWDLAGNVEEYYVYIDLSAPTLAVNAVYGNNTSQIVTFDETLVTDFAGTFRYLSIDMRSMMDSVDNYVTVKISGRKLNEVSYVQGDELPVLDGVEYYGNYTIELYDRSGNTLSFVITIAGEAPSMSNSSLSSETSCRLTLNVPDRNDAITNIKLFYITYEGEYQELTTDHKGVPVSADTLQYTLLTGGKYTIWYQDLFGREAYCPYVFYLKGLPTGTLSGVTEGGITNKNVSLKYNDGNTLILYRVENGNRTEVPLDGVVFGQTYDETTRKYTATLMATEETSAA